MKKLPITLSLILSFSFSSQLCAGTAYWDSNGALSGAGITPTGTWGADNFWSTASMGNLATTAWTAADTAVFSAGADAVGPYNVTVTGVQNVGGLVIEEGAVSLSGGEVAAGAGALAINSGATLSLDNSLRLTTTTGSVLTMNGGTLVNSTNTFALPFFDTDTQIVLGVGGGVFSHTGSSGLNIMEVATKISGTGSFTKAGSGVLAIASASGNNTWTGATIVSEGELRIRGTGNPLPITTAVTVNSGATLNLNGVAQTIGSLSGSGNVGLQAATGAANTLTISGSTNTTFSGALKNSTISASPANNGRLAKAGTGVITFEGLNDFRGRITMTEGGIIVSPGATLCHPLADLFINGGTLTLNNAAQTIENLSGTASGTIVLGAGHVLTTDPAGNATFAGVISGTGSLVKSNALSGANIRTLTLSGINTYSGSTTISGGILTLTGSIANSSVIDVKAGATFNVSGVTGGFSLGGGQLLQGSGTVNGPINILGTLAPGNSAGTITFNNALAFGDVSLLNLEIGGTSSTDFDKITGVTDLTLNGTFVVSLINSFDPAPGNVFDVLDWSGALVSTSFNVATDLVTPALGGGKSWDKSNFLTNGSLTVIPESSTAALLLGTLSLAGIRRRRFSAKA